MRVMTTMVINITMTTTTMMNLFVKSKRTFIYTVTPDQPVPVLTL